MEMDTGNERMNEIFEVLCTHALTAAMCTFAVILQFCSHIHWLPLHKIKHGDKLEIGYNPDHFCGGILETIATMNRALVPKHGGTLGSCKPQSVVMQREVVDTGCGQLSCPG